MLQPDPRAGSRGSAARGFPKQSHIPESREGGRADQPVRVAGCSAEASQPLENEGFVSRTSQRRLESPLDRQPATRMLSAWQQRGLLRPCCREQDVPGTTSARRRGEAWPRLLLTHRSDGSVSAHQRGGIGAPPHSGLRSQPAKIPRAASSRQRVLLFSAEMCAAWKFGAVCNVFPLETSRRCLPSRCSRKEEEESKDAAGAACNVWALALRSHP